MLGKLATIAVLAAVTPRGAHAQACCAGAAAVTPGRLALHEDELVGIQVRVADAYGSFDPTGTFLSMPPGASELDLEQDLFGAVRIPWLPRAQLALDVPIIETRRTIPGDSELGGGLGDINVAARYDFLYSAEARYLPGIAVLAGVTVPTGTPPEDANTELATGATGIGTYQLNAGVALEKALGPWLVGATAILAKRTQRSEEMVTEDLATQWTALVLAAYTLPSEVAVALAASLADEGNATIDDMLQPETRRRLVAVTASGVVPVSDRLRLQAAVTVDPPVSSFGVNQPSASVGVAITVIYARL